MIWSTYITHSIDIGLEIILLREWIFTPPKFRPSATYKLNCDDQTANGCFVFRLVEMRVMYCFTRSAFCTVYRVAQKKPDN